MKRGQGHAGPVVAGAGALPADRLMPQSCCQDPAWHVLTTAACATRFQGTALKARNAHCQGGAGWCRFARLTVQRLCLSGLPSNQAGKEMGIRSAQPQKQSTRDPGEPRAKAPRREQPRPGWVLPRFQAHHPGQPSDCGQAGAYSADHINQTATETHRQPHS